MSGSYDKGSVFFDKVMGFFTSWRFPSFMLSTLLFFTVALICVLLIPPAQSGLGAFAADFKIWCFGYDPVTGKPEWIYVIMLILNPVMLAGIIFMVWWEPLRAVIRERPRVLLRSIGAALLLTIACGAGITTFATPGASYGPAFPADALRTSLPPPAFSLINQNEKVVSLADLEGRVGMLTAVYATCGYTCPMILSQAKWVTSALSEDELKGLSVIAVTLDPERDTPKMMSSMAAAHSIGAPLYHLVTGHPDDVNRVLDDMGVSRRKDPETGIIDHTNIFILIDRQGRVAYRFSLGDLQEKWLLEAVRLLLEEGADDVAGNDRQI